MPRGRKPAKEYKTTKAQRNASKNFYKRQKAAESGYKQKAISATLPQVEAEQITALLKAHGVRPSDLIRATAHRLQAGQDTAEQIRQACQAWNATRAEAQPGTEAAEATQNAADDPGDN